MSTIAMGLLTLLVIAVVYKSVIEERAEKDEKVKSNSMKR